MLFYQVELIKHGHDTCLEFMEFAASGDYTETQAHFHSTMEITLLVDGEGFFFCVLYFSFFLQMY